MEKGCKGRSKPRMKGVVFTGPAEEILETQQTVPVIKRSLGIA